MSLLIRRFWQWISPKRPKKKHTGVVIIPRKAHPITRKHIPETALKVLYRLNHSGFEAYLVGGGVRDLLLGKTPKDFDVATNATPEEIRRLFRNSRIIGRRFRLVHVTFGREIIEVATFRAQQSSGDNIIKSDDSGFLLRDNVYGNQEQDAFRRDFTVNALYYNIKDFSVVDYAGGMQDLKARILRIIGDPKIRLREDPVRMIRAVRLAAKLQFTIDPLTIAEFKNLASLLTRVPPARLFDEFLKFVHSGALAVGIKMLVSYELFQPWFPFIPETATNLDNFYWQFTIAVMESTDKRVYEDKPVTVAFVLAGLLWGTLQTILATHKNGPRYSLLETAVEETFKTCQQYMVVPKRIQSNVRDLWFMVMRMCDFRHKALHLQNDPVFRAAYDFLIILGSLESSYREIAEWWNAFVALEGEAQEKWVADLPRMRKKRTFRKRSKKKIERE